MQRKRKEKGEEKGERSRVKRRESFTFPNPPPHNPRHFTRVEWMERWKGWLSRSGAFPLWSAWVWG